MTKGEQILKFIKKAGTKGRRFREIQRFIFKKNHPHLEFGHSSTNRGYYCNPLCGTYKQKGLLKYCTKNKKGAWTLNQMPSNSNLYSLRSNPK
jgi:hypothetical protein